MNAPLPHAQAIRTACPYCGVGCGVLARPNGEGGAIISGDPDHPANFGRLCSKGFALDETLGLDGRLLHPMLRQADDSLARVDWDQALGRVSDGLRRIVECDGPPAVAFYLSGQLLTEDYYVANKLMKGFIGSSNVDTNSRLCMASTVAGQRRAFGEDVVPGNYGDLDAADLLVLVGSNTAWCHPVLFQRMIRNRKERGAKIVVIDPRRTMTARDADLFLPIAPGTDTALFCGLLVHLADSGKLDEGYIARRTNGFAETLTRAREIAPDVGATAVATGLSEADVSTFFGLFETVENAVTCFSQGVNQSAQGTDKVNAIINCHLATGRIGRPGMGPFSLTGQPNAMGGREVGGLANQLAAHMGFAPDEVDRVRRFWKAPRMAEREGLKAVQLFEAIERSEIKALWVMATNPAMSLPRAGAWRDALRKLELFVVSDVVASNDTIESGAHVLLPAAAWGEKDGTVTNSERRISRQRAFLPAPGDAKPDWWIVSEVGKRLGFEEAFSYRTPADVFREHAALSCFENDGARAFDLGSLASLSDRHYATFEPVQWPVMADGTGAARLYADNRFSTSDGKARFIAPEPPRLRDDVSEDYPLRLNTGRLRDQWHSMTRSGQSARLATHRPEPFVEIHPLDAAAYGLKHDGFARVATPHGACTLKVVIDPGQRRGSVFVPIHWSDATSSDACVGDLVAPVTDPHSGQPESKATPVGIAPLSFVYRGAAMTCGGMAFPDGTWWSRLRTAEGWGWSLATNDGPAAWRAAAPDLFGLHAVLTEYVDREKGIYRAAAFEDGRLVGALFIGPEGTPLPKLQSVGVLPVVCACFDVASDVIREAVNAKSMTTAEEVGRLLRAGTKCGTCLPELREILNEPRVAVVP